MHFEQIIQQIVPITIMIATTVVTVVVVIVAVRHKIKYDKLSDCNSILNPTSKFVYINHRAASRLYHFKTTVENETCDFMHPSSFLHHLPTENEVARYELKNTTLDILLTTLDWRETH